MEVTQTTKKAVPQVNSRVRLAAGFSSIFNVIFSIFNLSLNLRQFLSIFFIEYLPVNITISVEFLLTLTLTFIPFLLVSIIGQSLHHCRYHCQNHFKFLINYPVVHAARNPACHPPVDHSHPIVNTCWLVAELARCLVIRVRPPNLKSSPSTSLTNLNNPSNSYDDVSICWLPLSQGLTFHISFWDFPH